VTELAIASVAKDNSVESWADAWNVAFALVPGWAAANMKGIVLPAAEMVVARAMRAIGFTREQHC